VQRAGRRLVPDSCRFTLSLTKGCLAAIVAALGGGGGGAQVGGAFTLDATQVAMEVEVGGGGEVGVRCGVTETLDFKL
jgi:hypothetical protein